MGSDGLEAVMGIVLRRNGAIELNLVEYRASVTPAELSRLAQFQADHLASCKSDALNLITADADFSAVDHAALDALLAFYRDVYQNIDFQLLRRAAWVCASPSALAHLDYWLRDRTHRDGFSTDVRMFDTIAAASEWLLLTAAEAAMVQSGEGFTDILHFESPIAASSHAR
jgi:hypothetical protein